MKPFRQCGFTLTEILIVVAIIGMLAAIGIPYVLNSYGNSKYYVKIRNIAEVEKAKQILTLPEENGLPGAMGLDDDSIPIQDNPAALSNLCAALSIKSLDELTVGGDEIAAGSLSEKASY